MIGAYYRMVISNRIDFVGSFAFLQPTQAGIVAQQQESYGMNMNLVFDLLLAWLAQRALPPAVQRGRSHLVHAWPDDSAAT